MSRRLCAFALVLPLQNDTNLFIAEQCQYGKNRVLEQVEGCNQKCYEGEHVVDACVLLGTHTEDHLERHMEQLGVGRNQKKGVQKTACGGCEQYTGDQSRKCGTLGLLSIINDGSGNDEEASHYKACELADKCGIGSVDEKVQKNLNSTSTELDKLVGTRTRAIQRKLKAVQSLEDPDAEEGFYLEE